MQVLPLPSLIGNPSSIISPVNSPPQTPLNSLFPKILDSPICPSLPSSTSTAPVVFPFPARTSSLNPVPLMIELGLIRKLRALIRTAKRPLKDREALLECKGRNFYSVLAASTRREEERQRLESQQRKDGLVAKSRLISAKPDVKVKQMKGAKPDCVTVKKKFSRDRDRVVKAYEVRDKASALKAEDWDRVVAVFVLGKEWQFKDHAGDFH